MAGPELLCPKQGFWLKTFSLSGDSYALAGLDKNHSSETTQWLPDPSRAAAADPGSLGSWRQRGGPVVQRAELLSPAQGRSSPRDQVGSSPATRPPGKPGRAAAAASLGPQGRGQGLRPAPRPAVEHPGHQLTMGRRFKFLQKLAFLGQNHRYKALERDEVETLVSLGDSV